MTESRIGSPKGKATLRCRAMPVGYQGEPFSYSFTAAGELFPGHDRVGFPNFPAAFDALVDGTVARLVLPVENSTTGSVLPVLDRLVNGGTRIVAEHLLQVRHAVMGVQEATIESLREIRSHPEALSQAVDTIVHRGWEPMPVHDTAGAVRLVSELGDPSIGALAPPQAAEAHGLKILLTDAVDRLHNTTRFIVLEQGEPFVSGEANKSTIAFETQHRPGALALALTEIGLRGGNLTRIESRPTDEAWTYRFFVNLVHPPGPDGFNAIFDPIPITISEFHHLGSYLEAPH